MNMSFYQFPAGNFAYPGNNPNFSGPPFKDPFPLRSFCDPGLVNTCASQPIVDPNGPRRAVSTWRVNYLISSYINQASHTDPDLINPWGIVVCNNQLWIVNGSTDSISNYDLFGNKLLGTINCRDASQNAAFPTGIVVNCCGNFNVSNGNLTKSAQFLLCTEYGNVCAYSPSVDPLNAYVILNQQLIGEVAVFRGLAVVNNVMYLADFYQGHVDVFDGNYNRLLGFPFVDADTSDPIPLDYGPSNIVHIGPFLYIIYARRDPNITVQAQTGPGLGYVTIFNLDGSYVRRFTSRGVLNDPWGMIPAPCECGFPPGSILIGNRGDGRINIFDCNGRYVGPVLGMSGLPLMIEGLWGLAPHYTDFSEIYFTSAPDENVDGLCGSLVKDQVIYF